MCPSSRSLLLRVRSHAAPRASPHKARPQAPQHHATGSDCRPFSRQPPRTHSTPRDEPKLCVAQPRASAHSAASPHKPQVEVADASADFCVFSLLGAATADTLSQAKLGTAPPSGGCVALDADAGWAFSGTGLAAPGVTLLAHADRSAEVRTALEAVEGVELGAEIDYDLLSVLHGRPRAGFEISTRRRDCVRTSDARKRERSVGRTEGSAASVKRQTAADTHQVTLSVTSQRRTVSGASACREATSPRAAPLGVRSSRRRLQPLRAAETRLRDPARRTRHGSLTPRCVSFRGSALAHVDGVSEKRERRS